VSASPVAIPFIKASACGNDFLLIESAALQGDSTPKDLAELTKHICDRRNGVGADGVEWMYPHPSADIEIRLINSDGSEAEISGNGTRCVAAYLCASQEKERIAIQTGAGLKNCVLTGRSDSEFEFEIEMGEAAVSPELAVRVDSEEVRGIPVSMGNPHYVIFVHQFEENWQVKAAAIQRTSTFKHGVNVEMVRVDGMHDVTARFFERGAGETESSGTGSCAAAAAAMASRVAASPVRVHASGGTQTVRQEGHRLFLRGPARLVCRGDFFLT
jgi:diaminopimelate epimerase